MPPQIPPQAATGTAARPKSYTDEAFTLYPSRGNETVLASLLRTERIWFGPVPKGKRIKGKNFWKGGFYDCPVCGCDSFIWDQPHTMDSDFICVECEAWFRAVGKRDTVRTEPPKDGAEWENGAPGSRHTQGLEELEFEDDTNDSPSASGNGDLGATETETEEPAAYLVAENETQRHHFAWIVAELRERGLRAGFTYFK